MGDIAGNETSAWAALKRRKLVQWALAYAAGAWVLLQAVSLIAGVYGWPAPVQATERDHAIAVIDRCLATKPDITPFWAVKALLYLDEPGRVLAATQPRLTNNETFVFQMLWSPYGKSTRTHPGFAEFARKTGLVELWEKHGPPDLCREVAPGDYRCD